MVVDYQQNSVADLLQRGIAAASEKDKPAARALLQQVVAQDPNNEQGWLWLAAVAASPEDALANFQHVLAINPGNPQAQAGVRWAEARRLRTSQLAAQSTPASAALPPAAPTPMGAAPLPASLQTANRYSAPPDAPFAPSSASSPQVTEPDAFFTSPANANASAPTMRVTEPDAFFTPPAGVTPSPPANEPGIDVAALQRLTDSRRAAADQPPSARQGFFDINEEDDTPVAASSTTIADSTALPSPAPVVMPQDYDDSFAGMDDLANIDDSSLPPRTVSDEPKLAPRRERSVNLARQLAMEGAALDQKAGRLDANDGDATSIEAAQANAERRRSGASTAATRAASPGLFSSPLLVGAALLIALVAIGIIAFTMLGNSGSQPDATVINFMSAYNSGQVNKVPTDYHTYLTPALQKQMSSDASIQSYLTAFQKDIPDGPVDANGNKIFSTILQKIGDDPSGGKTRTEYYLYGKSAKTILDFGLEQSGGAWMIDYIGWVGGKLALSAEV